MQTQSSTHRFYNKWLYKVRLSVTSAYMVKSWLIAVIDTAVVSDEIKPLLIFLTNTPRDNYALRISRTTVDVYLNDEKSVKQLCIDCDEIVELVVVPEKSAIHLLEKHNTVVVTKLPFIKFQFKVYLKPRTIPGLDNRIMFYEWIQAQGDTIRQPKSLKYWILSPEKYYNRRIFIYVDSEQTLLMLTMKNAGAVGTIYRYVVNDK